MPVVVTLGIASKDDHVGRRRILLVAYVLFAIIGLAPLFLDSLTSIVISRILLGLPGSVVLTAGNTLIGDYYDGSERRKVLALQSAVGAVLSTAMWVVGGIVAELGWRWPFAIFGIAIPLFIAGWYLLFEPENTGAGHRAGGVSASERFPYAFMVLTSVVILVITTIYYIYTLYAGVAFEALGVKSPSMIGIVTGIAGIGVPVGAWFYAKISATSVGKLMAVMYVLLGLGLAGLGFSPGYMVGMAPAFVQQLGTGIGIPIVISWVQSGVPACHRGRAMGIFGMVFFLGQFTCPFFTSALNGQTGGILQTFVVVGAICFVVAALSFVFNRQLQPPEVA